MCATHANGTITAYFQGNLNWRRKCAEGFELLEKGVKPDLVVKSSKTAAQRLVLDAFNLELHEIESR